MGASDQLARAGKQSHIEDKRVAVSPARPRHATQPGNRASQGPSAHAIPVVTAALLQDEHLVAAGKMQRCCLVLLHNVAIVVLVPSRVWLLQSTDQFFPFSLLWTTQYTARSTAPSTYKYSACTCTSCPTHIVLTAKPTRLQTIPYRPPSSIRCHRLLRATPRICPVTATSGKPASPTSATFRRRDVQPYR